MADLTWFPHNPAKWRQRTAGLSPLAKAAYLELRDHAWESATRGEAPCTLPNDDKRLAVFSGLGTQWKKVRDEVLALYTVTDTLLTDGWLLATWDKQSTLHAATTARASAGGKAKARLAAAPSIPEEHLKSASSMLEAELKHAEEEKEGVVPGPKGPRVLTPAPELALAPVGAAPPVAADEKPPRSATVGNPQALANLTDLLTSTAHRATGALSREESIAEAQRQVDTRARRAAIEKHYWDQIGAKYDAWAIANERHATTHEDRMRATLAIRVDEKMHPQQAKTFRRLVLTAWRDGAQAPWIPDLETYVAEQETKLLAPQPAQRNGLQPHATL